MYVYFYLFYECVVWFCLVTQYSYYYIEKFYRENILYLEFCINDHVQSFFFFYVINSGKTLLSSLILDFQRGKLRVI